MAIEIKKTEDVKHGRLNLLVYGKPGAGKTYFSGTAIKAFKPLIISAESGLLSLRKLGNFDFIAVTKFEEIEESRQMIRYKNPGYDTVIMDSLTEIQQVCMDKILRDEKIEKARIQDWGTLNQRMVTMIRDFRDMDLNFIVTCLSESITDEETGVLMTAPLVQGRLKETLAGYFDEVLFLSSKEVKTAEGKTAIQRYAQTQGTNKIIAKDRSGKLPLFVRPDFCEIHSLIYKTEETKQ